MYFSHYIFSPGAEWRHIILWSLKPFDMTAFGQTEKKNAFLQHSCLYPPDWVCTTKRKSRTNSWDAAQRLGFHSVFTFSPLRLQKCQGGLWNPPSKIEFSRVKKKHAAVGVGRRLMKEKLLSSLLLLGLLWKGFEITVFYLRWSWHP